MTVFFAIPPERNGAANDICFNSLIDVAMMAGASGYKRVALNYTSTDKARNAIVDRFMAASKDPNDLLVMLDADHQHPMNIIQEFAAQPAMYGVVGALAYRRGEPYEPLFFLRQDGSLHAPVDFDRGPLYACPIVSTSAISIRRWVFDELIQKGFKPPFFRYSYNEETDATQPSEDMYFGAICEKAGISHYCDTSIIIPHSSYLFIDDKIHDAYKIEHPTETVEYIPTPSETPVPVTEGI